MTFITTLQQACALPYKQQEFLSDYEDGIEVVANEGVFRLFGMEIESPPGVYSPHETSSTRFLIGHTASLGLQQPFGEGHLLEIGCGAGAISIWFAKNGWNVTATDIDPAACEVTARNALNNGLDAEHLEIIESDLFESLQARTFDAIVFNQPFYHVERTIEEIERPLTATGSELYARFMKQAHAALRPGGFVVFTFANFSKHEDLQQPGWNLDLRAFEYAASSHSIRCLFRAEKDGPPSSITCRD